MAETEPLDIPSSNNEVSLEKAEEDDLEEGELRDDDDDDDEEKEKLDDKQVSPKAKSSTSGDETPVRPPSPASSSSSSSSSSPSSSSSSSTTSSSSSSSSSKSKALSSHHSSSSKNNNSTTNINNNTNHSTTSSSYDRNSRSRFSGNRRTSEDRYRIGWSREKEDPSEKAAKLISMRTKLLEARSREIELKFAKNKGKLPSPPPPPTLISSGPQKIVKMTAAKPIISYSENPNPPAIWIAPSLSTPNETPKKKSSKSKSKHSEKERKSKKKSKKHKKRKRSSSISSTKKSLSESKTTEPVTATAPTPLPAAAAVASSSSEPEALVEIKESKEPVELPYDNQDHVGPRTPPDNHVLTLEDEQIEWPSHLIRMTTTQPSISYSVNPDWYHRTRIRERREAASEERANKKRKSSIPLSPSLEATSEFTWYYNYFVNSFEMDHNQAQHQAYSALISASYDDEHRGDDVLSIGPVRPKYTEVKTERELVLPNGQVLPAGTVQKIVHPYPRIDSEVLGPLFDLY